MLTKGLGRVGTRRRVVGVELLRRRWDGVREDAAAGVLRASGLRGSTRDDPAEVLRGQEDRRWAGGEELRRRG